MVTQKTAVTQKAAMTQTLAEYVEDRIRGIFADVAEMVNGGQIGGEFSPDELAGVPQALLMAQERLVGEWHKVVRGEVVGETLRERSLASKARRAALVERTRRAVWGGR